MIFVNKAGWINHSGFVLLKSVTDNTRRKFPQGKQLLMGAPLRNAVVSHHQDLVGVLDGGQPVGAW